MVLAHSEYVGAPFPEGEQARQLRVDELCLTSLGQDPVFDKLVELAAECLDAPIVLISILDNQRQWFLARVGLGATETPRNQSFCAYAVLQQMPLQVTDALKDPRFENNPLVTGDPRIRFYAGMPLITEDGTGLGSLCVIDTKPRPELSASQLSILKHLADLVMARIMSLRERSFIDATTGLLNSERLANDVFLMQERTDNANVILVDVFVLSYVKDVVKALGFSFFNQLMVETTRRLQGFLPSGTHLYKASQTRFAVMIEDADGNLCESLSTGLLEALRDPILCDGIPIQTQAAVGLLPLHPGVADHSNWLRLAISASDYARSLSDNWAWFRPELDRAHQRSFALLGGIASALAADDQFRLEYQPKLSMVDGRITGVEALMRWTHPELGRVGPAEFIPLAEKTALVHALSLWVMEEALRQISDWRSQGLELTVSINISAGDLESPVFVERLQRAMQRLDVAPQWLELEFTESVLIRNPGVVNKQLMRLRDIGVKVAIDDFGTGYSNWSYLRQIDASGLKLDKSFVDGLQANTADRHMAQTIIELAHKLGFRVIAEGVETQEDYDLLASWGCDEVQGYLIAKPMPPASLFNWLAQRPELTAN